MQGRLFREKTLKRITSPEQLQDYMRVTNPGIWMVLAAVILLLAGLIVASTLFSAETAIMARGAIGEHGNSVVIELPLKEGEDVREGMTVKVAGRSGSISYVYENEGRIHATATLDGRAQPLPEGEYDVRIVTEALNPISFLLE